MAPLSAGTIVAIESFDQVSETLLPLDKPWSCRFNPSHNAGDHRVSRAKPRDRTKVERLLQLLNQRPVVLIGMMGAGKSSVGRRLATRLGWNFVDSDTEIETAAGMSIADFFAEHGEEEFRSGEARVIARLLRDPKTVLATGGGAYMSEATRDAMREQAVTVWINADLDLLFARVSRRSNRPLLKTPNPRQTLRNLMDARYPTYALADVTVTSKDVPQDVVASEIIDALIAYLEPGATADPVAEEITQND